MIGIYKITNTINNKVYIGQSINIDERWRAHKADYKNSHLTGKHKSYLYVSMRKYGIENFKFEVIEEAPKELLNEREIYWIQYYDATNPDKGYNLTPGGNLPRLNVTRSVCQYDTQGNFIAEYKSVKEASEITGINKTTISSCVARNNPAIKFAGGFIWRYEKVDKLSEIPENKRKVVSIAQYDLQGNLIHIFKSMSDASKETGITISAISNNCNGVRSIKSCHGYIFKRITDDSPVQYINNQGNNRIGVYVLDTDTNNITFYPSLKDTKKATHVDIRTIKEYIALHTKYQHFFFAYNKEELPKC